MVLFVLSGKSSGGWVQVVSFLLCLKGTKRGPFRWDTYRGWNKQVYDRDAVQPRTSMQSQQSSMVPHQTAKSLRDWWFMSLPLEGTVWLVYLFVCFFLCWGFTSWQHIGSCQDENWLCLLLCTLKSRGYVRWFSFVSFFCVRFLFIRIWRFPHRRLVFRPFHNLEVDSLYSICLIHVVILISPSIVCFVCCWSYKNG